MKNKKLLTTITAGILAISSILGTMTPMNAASETKNLKLYRFFEVGDDKDTDMFQNGYWAKQGVSYTPVWKTTNNEYVEPNYFRTDDNQIAYCIEPNKDAPASVYSSDKQISINEYQVIKNGYPSKSGADYGISDVELEWATTVALKSVSGNGDSYEISDFNTNLIPISEDKTIEAEKIKNVVVSLINSSKTAGEYDKFAINADSANIILENDTYKAGPYVIDTNLSGTISAELIGAPSSASIVKENNGYYVTVPEKDVLSDLSFSLVLKNDNKILSSDVYVPSSETEQSIYVYEMKDAVASTDISIVPEKTGIITINKKDTNGKAIANVEFTIFDEKGKEVEKIVTNEQGEASSSKLPLGTYTVIETKADGYILSKEEMKFTLTADKNSTVTEVNKTVTNKQNSVEITKVAAGTNNGLKGAELEILSSDGKTVATVTTNDEGKVVLKGLKAGTYTIKETKAPSGYKLSTETYNFSIDEYGTISGTTKIENSMIKVDIKKVDATTSKALEGATVEVRDKNKDLVFVGTTNSNGITTIEKLPAGTYTVTETKPPKGYQVNNNTFTFTVDEYGKVTGDTVIKDELTKVTITKKDSSDNKVLAGAKIVIKDSNGNIVLQSTTNDKGVVEVSGLAPGIYVFYEEEAPEGYIKTNEKSTFTINEKGESIDLTLYNTKFAISSTTDTSSTSSTSDSSSSEIIKTGVIDSNVNIIPYILLIVATITSISIIVYRKNKKNILN